MHNFYNLLPTLQSLWKHWSYLSHLKAKLGWNVNLKNIYKYFLLNGSLYNANNKKSYLKICIASFKWLPAEYLKKQTNKQKKKNIMGLYRNHILLEPKVMQVRLSFLLKSFLSCFEPGKTNSSIPKVIFPENFELKLTTLTICTICMKLLIFIWSSFGGHWFLRHSNIYHGMLVQEIIFDHINWQVKM